MGEHVLLLIIARIKNAKYYSVSIDSTPDVSHTDQLTLIFRYVEGTSPVERFVKFFANPGHKAEDMFNLLLDFLSQYDISINNWIGQSYDNASAMSGRVNGLQATVVVQFFYSKEYQTQGGALEQMPQRPLYLDMKLFMKLWIT